MMALENGETEPRITRAGARRVSAEKPSEHARQIFGGNPLPCVHHRQHRQAVL